MSARHGCRVKEYLCTWWYMIPSWLIEIDEDCGPKTVSRGGNGVMMESADGTQLEESNLGCKSSIMCKKIAVYTLFQRADQRFCDWLALPSPDLTARARGTEIASLTSVGRREGESRPPAGHVSTMWHSEIRYTQHFFIRKRDRGTQH